MNREELEHIIRASADVTDQYAFIIVGTLKNKGSVAFDRPSVDGSRSCESAATNGRRFEFQADCRMRALPGRRMLPVTTARPRSSAL